MGVSRWGVHPPGKLYEYQNKWVAAKGACMNMKKKDVIFCGVAGDLMAE
jgi:hypothetical protein